MVEPSPPISSGEPRQVNGVRAVVLAAGLGTRFGGGKLHAQLRGAPLAAWAFQAVRDARQSGLLDGAVAVVARGDHLLAALARDHGLDVAWNERPDDGLARSLRTGLHALQSPGLVPEAAAALIALGDQPFVRVEVVRTLLEAWHLERAHVVRPRYGDSKGEPGHPVVLDRRVWHLAERATGDRGFATFTVSTTRFVAVPGDNPDVDTPADLERIGGGGSTSG